MADAARARFFDRFENDILAKIPLTGRHVLAVGRDAGRLGPAFLRRAPLSLWSVTDPAGGQAAGLPADGPAPDVLVLGALEDLPDPLETLPRLASLMAAGGTVVTWLDNPGHLEALRSLFPAAGEMAAAAAPRRSLTLDDALGLLRAAGLIPAKISTRSDDSLDRIHDGVVPALADALARLGLDRAGVEERLRTLGYVIVASKPPRGQPLILHTLVMAPELMAARIDLPLAALNSLPEVHAVPVRELSGLPKTAPGMAKILVLQRQLVMSREDWLRAMARIVSQGWLVVAEWDDHPELLPPSVRERWLVNPWLPFSGVHAVQVSTPRLARALREHNPEVQVLPNALLELPPLTPRTGPWTRIVCAAMSRPGLAEIVAPALDAAAEADGRVMIEIVADAELFAALRTERKRFHQLLSYPDYLALMEMADISVMPIQGLPAERFKSPLKFLEGAGRGAVCVGSPVLYDEVIRHGRNGLLAETPGQWTDALLALVRQPELRARLAEGGWRSVRDSHMLSGAVGDRVSWYRGLWRRRHELRAALARRHPEFPISAEP